MYLFTSQLYEDLFWLLAVLSAPDSSKKKSKLLKDTFAEAKKYITLKNKLKVIWKVRQKPVGSSAGKWQVDMLATIIHKGIQTCFLLFLFF